MICNNIKEDLYKGMEKAVEVLKQTLGPTNKNIVILKNGNTLISSDGLTIAKNIVLDGNLKVGLELLISGALITKEYINDSTTSTMILSFEFIKKCKSGLLYDINVLIDSFQKLIEEELLKEAIIINTKDHLYDVCYTASNDVSIASIVSSAVFEVGKFGYINIKPTYKDYIYYELEKGFCYEKGYVSSYLANNETVILNNANVIIVNDEITKISEIEELISVERNSKKDLLIIAINYSKEVIDYIIFLKKSYNFNICATFAPEFGNNAFLYLEDLAIYLDAFIVTTKNVSSKIEYKSIVDYVEITKNYTLIKKNNLNEERMKQRIDYLKEELSKTKNDLTSKRLAKLINSNVIIYLPSKKDYEYEILKEKTFNAIGSAFNAFHSYGLYGGGFCLNLVYEKLKSKKYSNSLEDLVYKELLSALPIIKNTIYNDKEFKLDPKIIDPFSNIKAVLANALYVLKLYLSIDTVLVNEEKKEYEIF